MKKMNIPLIVINWWAIRAYDVNRSDNLIRNSLSTRYLKFLFRYFILTMINIIDDKCINLKRKIILENSNGKRKYLYLISPIDSGNKIYWSIKDVMDIFPNNNIIKKRDMITREPKAPYKILLKSKLNEK